MRRTVLALVCVLAVSSAAHATTPPAAGVAAAASADNPHHFGISFGSTIAEGSAPLGGGAALRLFGGTRLTKNVSLEIGLAYVDYFSRGGAAGATAALSLSAEARFEVPLSGEWLRFYGRGGAYYALGLSFFHVYGSPDQRQQIQGPGITFGGGLRFRVWKIPKSGTEMFLGAEFASMWTFVGGDSGPTVQNMLSLPVSVSWR